MTCNTINSSLTQYYVAAEQQECRNNDDDSDRISLKYKDGHLSSHSTGEHYAMKDITDRSRQTLTQ